VFRKRIEPASEPIQLPRPPQPTITPSSFLLCPVSGGISPEQKLWQQWLYLQAFQEAQRVVQPSIVERDLLGVWN
jgi:hypothetical protein